MSIALHFVFAAVCIGLALLDLSIGSPRAALVCAFCAGTCFAFGLATCMDRAIRRGP